METGTQNLRAPKTQKLGRGCQTQACFHCQEKRVSPRHSLPPCTQHYCQNPGSGVWSHKQSSLLGHTWGEGMLDHWRGANGPLHLGLPLCDGFSLFFFNNKIPFVFHGCVGN